MTADPDPPKGSRVARVPWSGGGAGGAGQQGDEVLGVGAAPAGDRVPAGSRVVAGDDAALPLHGVVAGGHVVEGLVVSRAAGDGVDGGVDEAQVLSGLLVG